MEKSTLRGLMLGIIFSCLAFVLFSTPGNGGSHIMSELFNCGHFPLFGVMTVALFYYLEFGSARGLKNMVIAWLVIVLLGAGVEIVQLFQPGRSCELRDLLYDAMGALAFLAFTYALRTEGSRYRRKIILGAAVLCAAATIPIWLAVAEWVEMYRAFPLIASFETRREMQRWDGNDATISAVGQHATHGNAAARVHLFPGTYPGVNSDYFIRDWRGYQSLSFDIFLDDTHPLELTIRINDQRHTHQYSDRFNRTLTLQPGANHLTIALADVANAPRKRKMDMQQVALICIFAYHLKAERTLFFDQFCLR